MDKREGYVAANAVYLHPKGSDRTGSRACCQRGSTRHGAMRTEAKGWLEGQCPMTQLGSASATKRQTDTGQNRTRGP
eukprot:8611604-Pyramimonas_sp.AAC.1